MWQFACWRHQNHYIRNLPQWHTWWTNNSEGWTNKKQRNISEVRTQNSKSNNVKKGTKIRRQKNNYYYKDNTKPLSNPVSSSLLCANSLRGILHCNTLSLSPTPPWVCGCSLYNHRSRVSKLFTTIYNKSVCVIQFCIRVFSYLGC